MDDHQTRARAADPGAECPPRRRLPRARDREGGNRPLVAGVQPPPASRGRSTACAPPGASTATCEAALRTRDADGRAATSCAGATSAGGCSSTTSAPVRHLLRAGEPTGHGPPGPRPAAPSRHRRPVGLGLPVRHRFRRGRGVGRGRYARLAQGAAAGARRRRTAMGRCRCDQPRLTGEDHVKIGHGRYYPDVPPIKGGYRGPAQAKLDAGVTMTRLDRPDPASIARS